MLLGTILRGLPGLLLRPWDFPLFWVLVGLVALQYRRVAESERRLYGVAKNDALHQVVIALLFGLGGGILTSMLMAALGASLSGAGVTYLLPLALLLMAVNPRLMCFSYAGGLISFSYLLFGWPKVYVPSIMALVAVLHLAESVLIYFRGSGCTTPVTVRNASTETVRTGFLMQGFWPLPLLLLFVVSLGPDAGREGLIEMPSWWPLIVPPAEIAAQENAVFTLFPVAAVLGYSDLAARFRPAHKARRSSIMLLGYSVILLALAVLASREPRLVWLPAIWGPVGHEYVVKLGARGEFRAEAAIVAASDGLTVFDVLPRSGAAKAGLRTGDVILSVDSLPVADILGPGAAFVWGAEERQAKIVYRRDGRECVVYARIKPLGQGQPPVLGVIPVPPADAVPQMEVHNRGYLATLLARLRDRRRQG